MGVGKARIADNLARIRERISASAARAGRDAAGIKLIAVTKAVGPEEVAALYELGVRDFGENRPEQVGEKVAAMRGREDVSWHLIAPPQRRKVRDALPVFQYFDALDRLRLARALQQQCEEAGLEKPVLLEVNISGEEAKHGFAPADISDALDVLRGLDRIEVRGLMTMAPYGAPEAQLREVFGGLRELAQAHELPVISMGMTDDFEIAIEEGATEVRVGRALYA